MAACAAEEQGKFEEMSEHIWTAVEERQITEERMTAIAQEIGLDMTKYQADSKGEQCMQWIQQSQEKLAEFGVSGTPAFFVNGRYLSGAQPLPAFDKLIQEELEKAKKSDVPAGEYYDKVIVAQGLKELTEDE